MLPAVWAVIKSTTAATMTPIEVSTTFMKIGGRCGLMTKIYAAAAPTIARVAATMKRVSFDARAKNRRSSSSINRYKLKKGQKITDVNRPEAAAMNAKGAQRTTMMAAPIIHA